MAKAPKRKPWTSEDVKTLKKLARQKTGAEKIAKTLKRTPAAVRNNVSPTNPGRGDNADG